MGLSFFIEQYGTSLGHGDQHIARAQLIYTHLNMPLTALSELRDKGKDDSRFAALADIVDAHKGLWCPEAEEYLLAHFISE